MLKKPNLQAQKDRSTRQKTTLRFDRKLDRWYAELGDRNDVLHCGKCFLLYVEKTAYPCRLELDTNGYVILPETQFALHTSTVYTGCL